MLVDEIAALDGIDSLIIGTNDLTAELGVPGVYESPGSQRLISATSTLTKSMATGLELAVFTHA
jgi:2-keto-3-deoxy-L-rhamnonate aldolase RhmA